MDKPTQNPSIADLVIAGLANGRLWILESGPVWVGHGTFQPCTVCRLKIGRQEIQYDVLGLRGSLPVHFSCHLTWRAQSDKLKRKR